VYKTSNPSVNYKYDQEKQIHDYSNNWDFDKDGKLDRIYFVGTGGAHLYYFLRIILSSDNAVRNFPFIHSDFPVLPKDEELKKAAYKPDGTQTHFAVFEQNNNPGVFVKLDNSSFAVEKKVLKKRGVNTNFVVLSFKDGKANFRDLSDSR
jgi:hypothetical protein